MAERADYVQKVYAGVLGKVIGVYVGKPFEGWLNDRIERELGEIWYYVHHRLSRDVQSPGSAIGGSCPLVAADDDISGTFTFLRAMEDHDAWGQVTSEQIGRTWLNYLIEHQTVLWWGGLGVSTEHTAWLRLAGGVAAPRSGSIELNGRTVAEQIGAQIFIDGWGMVAPGRPELAAELAGRAGRVSHDGEAVHAAQVVAAMEAAAFVESDMDRLLDTGVSVIPANCLIARIHRDVRSWAARHRDDWRETFRRIQRKYGYDRYGGGCHVVPNHAVMVMAWAHAPDDFQKALMIVNTAGWDTDCNSGNVGCLMGIKLGLAGIARGPDWQGPFADRVLIPTAEGSRGVSDCLREADQVVRCGRKVMGWRDRGGPKNGARFHFSLPGSRHGFLPERAVGTGDSVRVSNPVRRLRIEFSHIAPGQPARAVTPTFLTPEQLARGRTGYRLAVTPTLYSGQTVTAAVSAPRANRTPVNVRLFVRHYVGDDMAADELKASLSGLAACEPVRLRPGGAAAIRWTIPDTGGWPVAMLGIQIDCLGKHATGPQAGAARPGSAGSGGPISGSVEVDWVTWSGAPRIRFDKVLRDGRGQTGLMGWCVNCPVTYRHAWGPNVTLVANRGVGLMHTGTAEWTDYAVSGKLAVRLADRAGLAARYAGLNRYVAVVFDRLAEELQLVRQFDEECQVLSAVRRDWKLNEVHALRLVVKGSRATVFADGRKVLSGGFAGLSAGGIACLSDTGTTSFADLAVGPA